MTKHLVFALALAASAAAQTAKNDYADGKNWLCRPGRQDACAVDQTTTIVAADGTLTREPWKADPAAPIDCFYVYPTVSLDPGGNSDMVAGPEENGVVRAQLARFASQCKVYAPLYRQATLTALRAAAGSNPIAVDRALGYNDVVDAWNSYLQRDNNGRGVVLIGHSQGSGVLTQLIRNEIDGKPVQARLVSALLLGTSLPVPKGKDVGGAFQHIPLCRSAKQTGCVIAYASFRSTVPPPENSRFGRVQGENMAAACANPAALGGRQRRAARVSRGRRPEPRRVLVGAAPVGHAGAADRHAVCQRAGPPDRSVRVEREGLVPRGHRPRQSRGSARRRHRRRRDDEWTGERELGAAPDRRAGRDGQPGRHRPPAGESVLGRKEKGIARSVTVRLKADTTYLYFNSKIVAFVAAPIGSSLCIVPAGTKTACPVRPLLQTTTVSIGWRCWVDDGGRG